MLYEFNIDTEGIGFLKGEIIQLLPPYERGKKLIKVKVIKCKFDGEENNKVHEIYSSWLNDGTLIKL